jgi:C-terminal processing protease CtpA/Prc
MNKEEIYKRIMVCEKKERDFLEVGNTRTANRYHNEIQKWEKLLNQLNPKMEQELNEYRRGYYKKKEVIDRAIELLESQEQDMMGNYFFDDNIAEQLLDILKEVSE